MSYQEYSKFMTYEEYSKMNDDSNNLIINCVYKLYTLGCWIGSMYRSPISNSVQFVIKCSVRNAKCISDDDSLRSQLAAGYLKEHLSRSVSFLVLTKIDYTEEIIDKASIVNGIKCMLSN